MVAEVILPRMKMFRQMLEVKHRWHHRRARATINMPDTNLEKAFLTLLNGEMTPNMEYVTLDSGREAIKFEGIQSQDDYGTYRDCPVYGHAVMCEDVPVIVSYIIINADNVDEDTQMEMVHVVDEMVNTIRMKK